MKRLTFLCAVLVIIAAFLIINITSGKESSKFISPLLKQERVLGINQWFPKLAAVGQTNAPQISAKSGFFIETKSGQILYEKNAQQRLPVASLVKVMTALIALEQRNM